MEAKTGLRYDTGICPTLRLVLRGGILSRPRSGAAWPGVDDMLALKLLSKNIPDCGVSM
jgi:hypothetical protein